MPRNLYPIPVSTGGMLAIAARPRGGDWIEDDLEVWKEAGIDTVVSLLTDEEAFDLDLTPEGEACQRSGLGYVSFPIEDRSVPVSQGPALLLMEDLAARLRAREGVLIHCRQGIGRAATVAAGTLIADGWSVADAVRVVSEARGVQIPETAEQRQWLESLVPVLRD